MKIRNNWMTDNQYFSGDYPNNELLDLAIERFELQLTSLEGRDATINGISERIIAKNYTNSVNAEKYDKKGCFKKDTVAKRGSIVIFDSLMYVVSSDLVYKNAYYTADMTYCADTNVMIPDTTANISKYISIPYIIINNPTITLNQNNYFEIQNGNFSIQVPSNINTLAMYSGMRIILGKLNVWKIAGVNDIYSDGFLKLDLEITEKDSRDDFVTGIAYNEDVKTNNYIIDILNGDSIQFSTSQTIQLNVQVTNNDEVIDNQSLVYLSSNDSVCTVNSSGLLTGVSSGSAIITCALASEENVKDTVSVEVVAVEQDNFTATIIGSSQIIKNHTSNYSVKFMNNGSEITKESVFYLTADDGITPLSDTIAVIQSQDSVANTATIQVKSPSGIVYFKLWAKSSDNLVLSEGLRVKIASLI